MKTYYVTQEQLKFIEYIKSRSFPAFKLISSGDEFKSLFVNANKFPTIFEQDLLRYLGGDKTIEFKVKEQLYRLWRIDDSGNSVYMQINGLGTPTFTINSEIAFTAPLEETKKWKTPAWEIEEVK